MKICKECEKEVPKLFSHGRCYYCARKTYKPASKKSDKQRSKDAVYIQVKRDIKERLKLQGHWKCMFSNEPIGERPPFHHLLGRDNDLMTDPSFLMPCKAKWHTGDEGWHTLPLSKFIELSIWPIFVENVKEHYPLYVKHLNRLLTKNDLPTI